MGREHQHRDEAEQSAGTADDQPAGDPSLSELMGDVMDLGQRGARTWSEVRDDWEARSRTDGPWTTDSIMNEVVNSWERVTPLMGEAIDAGITGFTWALRNYWPTVEHDLDALQATVEDSPAGAAATPYLDTHRDAVARMLRADYRSADAVEHWAQYYGQAVKDLWRASADARADRSPNQPTADQANPQPEDPNAPGRPAEADER